jgi:hypothetical protein
MRQIPAFSKKMTNIPITTGGATRKGFTPNVMVSKQIAPKPISGMAGFKSGGSKGPKAQIGGRTPGSENAPGNKGRHVHAAKTPPAFSKKKI